MPVRSFCFPTTTPTYHENAMFWARLSAYDWGMKRFIEDAKRIFRALSIRYKISIPYLALAIILAGVISYQLGVSFVGILENRLRGQLADISVRTAEVIVDLENEHLRIARAISFTDGFGDAVAKEDVVRVENLARPIAINEGVVLIDVLTNSGAPIFTLHKNEDGLLIANETDNDPGWEVVRDVLAGRQDESGHRFTSIETTAWGDAVYTAGPIYRGEQLVGMVLIGTPLADLATLSAKSGFADITFYRDNGLVAYTTFGADDFAVLDADLTADVQSFDSIPTRYVVARDSTYIEALAPLRLRGEVTGWAYGAALPELIVTEARSRTVVPLFVIFSLSFVAVILLGVLISNSISNPLTALVDATQRVGEGDLTIKLPVNSTDEIGILERGFNRMVKGLQQQERVRDLFGRMVSTEIRENVLNNQIELGGEFINATVVSIEIKNFAELTEDNLPKDIINMLNEVLGIVTHIAETHRGLTIINGAQTLVVFGAPIKRSISETTYDAILTAIEVWQKLTIHNAARVREDQLKIPIRIGVNAGTVVAGNIGSASRFSYSVVGDAVNVATSIGSIADTFFLVPIVIPSSCLVAVRRHENLSFIPLGEFRVGGKNEPTSTHAVMALKNYTAKYYAFLEPLKAPKDLVIMAAYLVSLGHTPEHIAQVLNVELDAVKEWVIEVTKQPQMTEILLKAEFNADTEAISQFHEFAKLAKKARMTHVD